MTRQEQAAIEAVARHFSATWKSADVRPDAYLSVAGKRIAVDVATIKGKLAVAADAAKPRLRFDRVVIGLVARLQAALSDDVPAGRAVLVTVTAPIRLPGQTAVAIEAKIRTCLARRAAMVACKDTICGNEVHIRVVKSNAQQASKVIGLVHNPETDPDALLNLTQALLQTIGAAAGKCASTRFRGERWLVLVAAGGPPHIETYRQVYAQMSIPNDFARIVMVRAHGRVETLTG